MKINQQSTPAAQCPYCGNNPTNHTMSYLSQSILVLGLPFGTTFSFLMRPLFFTLIHNTFVTLLMTILEYTGLVAFHNDSEKASSDRSKVIWKEAEARGIPMQQLLAAGKPSEFYRARVQNRWYYFTSIPLPLYMDQSAYLWIDSKVHLKKFFIKRGVQVPKGGAAHSLKAAETIFNRIQKPVIVKPANGSRGRHSLTHLSTLEDVRHGFKIAQQLCMSVVVEEHLMGSVYRATYVGGEIVGILRGDPPRVTGDGRSTITELMERKNREKPAEVKAVTQNAMIAECIARQGFSYDSIIPNGTRIDLLEKIGLSYGGDAVEEFPITHPKLLAHLKKAGDVLNVPLIGFDFISEDITKDPDTVRWGIIEANSMPFIDLHHHPRLGTPINVAKKVWDLWEKQ